MKFNTRTIVATGIGAAVFFVLNRFVSIPTGIPNTNISTAYPFLAFMAVLFGPIAGGLIGLIGHFLTDLSFGYGIWWSWVIVSVFVGAAIGFCSDKLDIESGKFGGKEILTFNIFQILANVVGWFGLAPLLDKVIYAEPYDKVLTQGITAGIANAVSVAILGTIFLVIYAKTRVSAGSLSKEE